MNERLGVIIGTYIRRPTTKEAVLPVGGVLNLVIAVLVATRRRDSSQLLGWVPSAGMAIAFIGFPLWQRLRQHLLSERRRLWPNYVAPHFVVFLILLLCLGIIWPWALATMSGVSVLGLIACVFMLCVLTGFPVIWPTPLPFVLWFAAYSGSFLPPIDGQFDR